MARGKKVYDDDDGRTIADMSGLSQQPLWIPRLPSGRKEPAPRPEEPDREDRPWEKDRNTVSKEEKRWYVLGALKAALLIALVFIVGLGACIALLIWLWS